MRAALFDLDGTLVDSAPAILATYSWVLERHALSPAVPLDLSLIGPPLRTILGRVAGTSDAGVIETLAADFRERYDSIAIAATPPYPQLAATLDAVRAQGYTLFIATNKRIRATRLLLEHLGVAAAFHEICALDALDPPAPDKAAMVAGMLQRHGIDRRASVLVGDTMDDARAASANALAFVEAAYGYGTIAPGSAGVARVSALADLPAVLAGLAGLAR